MQPIECFPQVLFNDFLLMTVRLLFGGIRFFQTSGNINLVFFYLVIVIRRHGLKLKIFSLASSNINNSNLMILDLIPFRSFSRPEILNLIPFGS